MSITINTTAIPTPQTFEVTTFDVVKEGMTASGKTVADTIKQRKRFNLEYTDLTGTELAAILTLINTAYFMTLGYPTESGTATATVKRGEVPRKLWLNEGSKRYKDIRIELIEQ